jgi:SAM-dependent methyltransferase
MKKIFIDEEIRVFENENAVNKLTQINDSKFYNEIEKGVHKVDKERWLSAQKYEKKTWMGNLMIKDDRNYEHLDRFEQLSSVVGMFDNPKVIELGCGPFTNVRLMTDILNPSEITLLDPLINEYVNHPNCYYKNHSLNQVPVKTVNSPIESFTTEEKYDIVIMINVIEHCYDVNLIFDVIQNTLKNGGVFIFSDVYFEEIKERLQNTYDAGHPIRMSKEKINSFISKFKNIFEKRYNGLYNQDWRNDLYFIGVKE